MTNRFIDLMVAATTFTLGSILAANYPFGPLMPMGCFLAFSLLVFYRPSLFLIFIPALLPLIGFAPWTGWITFEELDLLVLAAASGGYARYALEGRRPANRQTSWLLRVLSVLMSVSMLISTARGFADAGGFVFGWFQGYSGPMNSIRIGKSFFLALLLVPLMARIQNTSDASRNLGLGIAIGLGTASLAALWERLAFTDLLNFSSDYRTTALFWEMHVGGAALDGWLLLTIPFAIWALRNSRSMLQFACSLGLVLLGGYACLTTFSRGVYIALVVSLPLLAWQTRRPAGDDQETPTWGFSHWLIALVLLGTMASLVFQNGGYRGLLALLGLLAVSSSMSWVFRKASFAQVLAGGSAGILFGALLVLAANFLPKGPYVLYGLLLALSFIALYWPGEIRTRAAICTASLVCLLLSAANVAHFWGGTEALMGMCGALLMLLSTLIWGTSSRTPLWPNKFRWQGCMLAIAVAVSAVIAVFSGGAYMGERFTSYKEDFGGRLSHWGLAIAMLKTPWDISFGKGLGRFPANYYFAIPNNEFPGAYQVRRENGNTFLSLVAPRHPLSFGDTLRISQRLGFATQGPFAVALKVRARSDVEIQAEVCEKQLLYAGACAIGGLTVKATDGEWRPAQILLENQALSGGPFYAPRIKMFSLTIENQSGAADLDDVVLITPGNANLLANSGFDHEMQHWFFTSDRDHMPWHAKNLFLNIFFDQGMIGLVAFLLLTACALWRLNFENAMRMELSPYSTAAIIGFLAVGMFDSLTDVPRLAFLYYLLIMHALSFGSFNRNPSTGTTSP
jgi:hypothetical protein